MYIPVRGIFVKRIYTIWGYFVKIKKSLCIIKFCKVILIDHRAVFF